MTPGHGAAPWVPAGLCREVLDTGLVRGAPARVCCRGLTHQCRIPSSTYKGLRGFHTSRVWPCCHHAEGKLRHRDGGCRRTERSNRSNRSSSRGEGAWLCRLPGSRPLCCCCLAARHDLPGAQRRGGGGCACGATTRAAEAALRTQGARPWAGRSLQPELGAGRSPGLQSRAIKGCCFSAKNFKTGKSPEWEAQALVLCRLARAPLLLEII